MNHWMLIETALDYFAAGDVDQILALCSDDVVFQLYISQSALPFGGIARGQDAVRDKFFDILAVFDCLAYEPVLLDLHRGVARVQSRFVYHHRASDERLEGTLRLVCTLKNGRILRIEEYHDDAMMKAFMCLAAWRIETRGPIRLALV